MQNNQLNLHKVNFVLIEMVLLNQNKLVMVFQPIQNHLLDFHLFGILLQRNSSKFDISHQFNSLRIRFAVTSIEHQIIGPNVCCR
jgi:hypothetical protein